jgi:hypothetical protein
LQEPGNGEDAVPLATWRMPLRAARPAQNDWAPLWEQPALLAGRGETLYQPCMKLTHGGVPKAAKV